ncbi:unnamed protein product [Victoria cruziana]
MSSLFVPSLPVHIHGKGAPVSVFNLSRNGPVVGNITIHASKQLDEFRPNGVKSYSFSKLGSGFHKVKGVHGSPKGIKSFCFVISCDGSTERGDSFYMNRCVELARKALGFTSPNPMVGCVIVKDGEVVGEGFHPKAGQPHAECRYSQSFNGVLLNEIGEGTTDVGGYFSQLLQQHDGVILTGSDLASNALLLSRETGANQPVQIIIVQSPKRHFDFSIFRTTTVKALVLTERNTFSVDEMEMVLKNKSIEIVALDRINMDVVLELCSKLGLCNVLVDVRGNHISHNEIIKQAMKEAMINKVVMEILPVWCNASPGSVDITRDVKLKDLQTRLSKNSVIVEGYVC